VMWTDPDEIEDGIHNGISGTTEAARSFEPASGDTATSFGRHATDCFALIGLLLFIGTLFALRWR